MVELTEIQTNIQNLLMQAIRDSNSQEVQNIFDNNEHNDIQAALSHDEALTGGKGTILDFAITCFNIAGEAQVEIIKLIWEEADQKTRDSVCCRAIDIFQDYKVDNISTLETVIQEVEEHKRVRGLDMVLKRAIRSLDVDQVKTALENCGEDVESVLTRNVYWSDATDIDCLLIYPLMVDYERNLGKEESEKIKEITKLLWDKASPDVCNFWLESHMINEEGQNTGNNYIIDSLEWQQGEHADMAGEGWLEDFIQKVKDYRRQRDIKLNGPILEEEDKQALELAKQESLLTAPIVTNTTAPTTGNTTPENNDNDTTFWSEHKGKIALGVTGLCVVGAIAAYVLAYPVVALVLAVSALAVLAGAYIGGVFENPSVEALVTPQKEAT